MKLVSGFETNRSIIIDDSQNSAENSLRDFARNFHIRFNYLKKIGFCAQHSRFCNVVYKEVEWAEFSFVRERKYRITENNGEKLLIETASKRLWL